MTIFAIGLGLFIFIGAAGTIVAVNGLVSLSEKHAADANKSIEIDDLT